MQIPGSVALVTGANRGLGRAFARALVARGARTVYAGARDPGTVTDPGVVPIELDITDPEQVAAVARRLDDVTLLVNNAGVSGSASFLGAGTSDPARAEMETNYFGTLSMSRAFAPVLARNGGGALVNVLSVLSFMTLPQVGSYSASKAAAWSLTNALRLDLAAQGTLVVGVHAGFIDTEMAAAVPLPKIAPEDVAGQTLDAVEAGAYEVLVDHYSRDAKAALSAAPEVLYPALRA
ncbi:short-chain dehydrogenase [Embleya scabrispora]|uniref:Short-chain dehydrogenase n=1 Tax=Embleya scabrispora TaxID=159449 RepID=A0A1T3NXK2_9ACTN|nr:SDR family oxidoreductase [Embleya scabrispora]OPC81548.1 short-chain dehydrogenase [Embleya scabrispora]